MGMNINKLLMMKAMSTKGWPADLQVYLLRRCSATEADYEELVASGLIRKTRAKLPRIVLTDEGKRRLKAELATHRWAV